MLTNLATHRLRIVDKFLRRRFLSSAVAGEHYDIVINGGGIVGLSLLRHLQKSPFLRQRRVLLLESQPKRNQIDLKDLNHERQLSNRVSSLTLQSKQMFEEIDLWSAIEPWSKPIRSMHVWSTDYGKGITFVPERNTILDSLLKKNVVNNDNVVCYIVENDIILSALYNELDENLVKHDAKVVALSAKDERLVELTLENGQRLTANLLIGSDGFNSIVRSNSNIAYFQHDLKQRAIVGTIQISRENDDTNDIAYQRFVPQLNSILALLPLTENYSSFVLSLSHANCDRYMSLSDDDFVSKLNEALWVNSINDESLLANFARNIDKVVTKLLPNFPHNQTPPPRLNPPNVISIIEDSRASFPLHFGTTIPWLVTSLKGSQTKNVVIIGDAAHRIHPLAGQGLNLGLGDAQILSDSLHNALSRGDLLFTRADSPQLTTSAPEALTDTLLSFESRRQLKLIPMLAAIHSMQNLFSLLPSNVFSAFNRLDVIKNEIVKFANRN